MSDTKYRVLVVDDEPDNLQLIEQILRDSYQLAFATSGEKALKVTPKLKPDLILLDIMMPGMDGYEVCKRLKADESTRDIPIIFVTAKNDVSDETRGFEMGAADYIIKPVSPPIVKARVRNLLNLKQAYEALAEKNKKLEETAILRENVERINRHDIKTPLNGIINIPELVMEGSNLTEKQKDLLKIAADGGRSILEMINRSLDLYKMETGSYRYEPLTVDLLPLIHKIIRETESLSSRKYVSAEIRVRGRPAADNDRFAVQGERLLCYSLFANLIKNAVEASPEKESITLSLEEKGEDSFITVHNLGTVREEIRGSFFEKYATAGKFRGTGLGTYSAKLMAETQRGGISLQTSEDSGTAITVRLRKTSAKEYAAAFPDSPDTAKSADINTADEMEELTVPPRPLLEQLYEFSRTGNITNIYSLLKEIEQAGEQYLPFAAKMRKWADEFYINKIRDFTKTKL
ncbi:MAG: response regulator [Gammaproteobacteria bacterium]|nr:response regulator [Gammaproteobacteria bacterium]